eukprot:UN31661
MTLSPIKDSDKDWNSSLDSMAWLITFIGGVLCWIIPMFFLGFNIKEFKTESRIWFLFACSFCDLSSDTFFIVSLIINSEYVYALILLMALVIPSFIQIILFIKTWSDDSDNKELVDFKFETTVVKKMLIISLFALSGFNPTYPVILKSNLLQVPLLGEDDRRAKKMVTFIGEDLTSIIVTILF